MTWRSQHQPEIDSDSKPYPYANILGDTRNRSHKRVNRLTIFCIITLALYILCWIF